jgi:hypothetical protein
MTTQILPITEDPWTPDSWATLIRWGVIRQQDLNNSFCKCELPNGWKVIPAGQANSTTLVDSRGLIRAKICCDDNLNASISTFERFVVQKIDRRDRYRISEQYHIFDRGLNRSVFVGEEIDCIVSDRSIGVIKDPHFYLFNGEKLEEVEELPKDWFYLTINEFNLNWYNRPETGKFVRSVKEMALIACENKLKNLPSDDSAWSEAFDFPEVKLPDDGETQIPDRPPAEL